MSEILERSEKADAFRLDGLLVKARIILRSRDGRRTQLRSQGRQDHAADCLDQLRRCVARRCGLHGARHIDGFDQSHRGCYAKAFRRRSPRHAIGDGSNLSGAKISGERLAHTRKPRAPFVSERMLSNELRELPL